MICIYTSHCQNLFVSLVCFSSNIFSMSSLSSSPTVTSARAKDLYKRFKKAVQEIQRKAQIFFPQRWLRGSSD